jgi:hypothetical protein
MRTRMFQSGLILGCFFTIAGASCAPSITTTATPNYTVAYFRPEPSPNEVRSLVPMPNILALNTANTPPTLSLSAAQCPSLATELILPGLEGLNGFGTYSKGSIYTYFSAPLDTASLAGNIKMYDLGYFATGAGADLANPINVVRIPTTLSAYVNGCASAPVAVDALVLVPVSATTGLPIVLNSFHKYGVAILQGVLDSNQQQVQSDYFWSFIRSKEPLIDPNDPTRMSNRTPLDVSVEATYEQVLQMAQVQAGYAPFLDALETTPGITRDQVLVGWVFNTEFTDDALMAIANPANPTGLVNLSSAYNSTAMLGLQAAPANLFLQGLGYTHGCTDVYGTGGCPGLGNLIAGGFVSPNYQTMVPPAGTFSPYTCVTSGCMVPGTFTSNINPAVQPSVQPPNFVSRAAGNTLSFLASTPAAPASGYPVVIFQHPLTPSDLTNGPKINKSTVLAVANTLGAAGMATIAIDTVLAGGRAVHVYNALDATVASGSKGPEELYPVLNTYGFVTRDNIRQTVVDLLQLVRVLKTCTDGTTCGGLNLGSTPKIYFLGASLGSDIGSLFTALSTDVKRAAFNVPVAGLNDAMMTSPVIAAELDATLFKGGITTTQHCGQVAAGYCAPAELAAFDADQVVEQLGIINQWIFDPADPINYLATVQAAMTSSRSLKVFVQQVTGDQVFPNTSTKIFAGFLGYAPPTASRGTSAPSAYTYVTYDADMTTTTTTTLPNGFVTQPCLASPAYPDNILLLPCGNGAATLYMQTDMATFFATP